MDFNREALLYIFGQITQEEFEEIEAQKDKELLEKILKAQGSAD